MLRERGRDPAWLYSFVDLAFLLLIALSQVETAERRVELVQIEVPHVGASETARLPKDAAERWQVRVYPPDAELPAPFTVGRRGDGASGAPRLDVAALGTRLAALRNAAQPKPLLAPHEDSRTQDLLDAVAALEHLWPTERRATIAPVSARR